MFEFDTEVDTLEGVPEEYRGLYSETDEGKFQLDEALARRLSGGANAAKALRDERANVSNLKRQLQAFKALGETPEAVQERIDEAEAKAGNSADREEIEAAIQRRFEAKEKTLNNQIAELKEELQGTREESDREFLGREIADAISTTNAIPTALRPILRERIRITREDGQRSVVVLDDEGQPAIGANGETLSVKAYAEKLRANEDYGFAFKASTPSGAGTGGGQKGPRGRHTGPNPFDPKTRNLTEQGRLRKENPDRARALAREAGLEVNW